MHRALALDAILRAAREPESRFLALLRKALAPRWQRAIDEFLALDDAPAPRS